MNWKWKAFQVSPRACREASQGLSTQTRAIPSDTPKPTPPLGVPCSGRRGKEALLLRSFVGNAGRLGSAHVGRGWALWSRSSRAPPRVRPARVAVGGQKKHVSRRAIKTCPSRPVQPAAVPPRKRRLKLATLFDNSWAALLLSYRTVELQPLFGSLGLPLRGAFRATQGTPAGRLTNHTHRKGEKHNHGGEIHTLEISIYR